MITALTTANTYEQLTNAVGPLGVVLTLTNGDWIAISYRDLHLLPIRSLAIAKDSGGQWFESHHHFCGSLSFWPRRKQNVADALALERDYPQASDDSVARLTNQTGYCEMFAIESAPDLTHARIALRKVHFHSRGKPGTGK
jgi:hypothetical protein